jgi:hypothetical protein
MEPIEEAYNYFDEYPLLNFRKLFIIIKGIIS